MNFLNNIKNAIQWVENNSTNEFMFISSNNKTAYNEVTGYFIPTLINYGIKNKAASFAKYLSSIQREDGSWGDSERRGQAFSFDVAQIIDGLSEFKPIYTKEIDMASRWVIKNINNNRYPSPDVKDHCDMRILYCLSKAGIDIGKDIAIYVNNGGIYEFDVLSHMYGYAFESCARLGLDCSPFINKALSYGGLIPERNNYSTYCFTGLSQFALSFFLCGQFDLGMKNLEFVSLFQNPSGGFYGSNGVYLRNEEISWAVKFYLDAFWECQKLWFVKNLHIFPDRFEGGMDDKRLNFIKGNIKSADKVLEVGCGKGRYINNLDCERYACDIADASKYINGKFLIGSCLNLPFDDKTFDVVFCSESLEHAIVIENAIRECRRVLKDGGLLLIVDKNKKTKTAETLHFGEEWLDFDYLKKSYGAEVIEIIDNKLAYPFYGARMIKYDK